MIERLPVPVWSRVIDFLGFNDFYQLRKLNRYFRNKIDNDACMIYVRFEGKINIDLSNYLSYPIIYPKLFMSKEEKYLLKIKNIKIDYIRGINNNLFKVIY